MKVAIPHWQGRISPVFDAARQLSVFEIDAGLLKGRHDIALADNDWQLRVAQLAQTGAVVLICGAISWPLELAVSSAGIEVVSQICGNVEDVLAAFIDGRLVYGGFFMPGCRGQRRKFRGRHGHGQHGR